MKKDLDYISNLEKAVKNKYGEKAIINPASLWDQDKEKEYLEQVKARAALLKEREGEYSDEDKDNFLVSKKLLNKVEEYVCPLVFCKKKKYNLKDTVYIKKRGCCHNCYILHVEGREDTWEERKKELEKDVTRET